MAHKRRYGKFLALSIVGLLIGCFQHSAEAEEVFITAMFKPDPSKPQQNTFENTTIPSGYCATYPDRCRDEEMFSLRVPLTFESNRAITPGYSDPREGATFLMPVAWRTLTVFHETTGEPQTLQVRISGFGTRVRSPNVLDLVDQDVTLPQAHDLLWGTGWLYAPAPCLGSGLSGYSQDSYLFFWKTTTTRGYCSKYARYNVPWLRYEYLDFAYQLRTPDPLKMASGRYNGSIQYTVGPDADIDMGHVMVPSSSTLGLNFSLDVQHTLKVDIPPGGNKVELVPEGGWQNWLQNGRKPVRLFRDQTFNISASSRFKMELSCFITGTNNCMIVDLVSGRTAEVQISISLPNGLTDVAGEPVKRKRFHPGSHRAQQFQPAFYVDRAPGVLHFEIDSTYVNSMLQAGRAATYSGSVTVIWDSEI
ncbi:hypothetical protein [Pseudomonas frederiksbergensis]|jgi:hypothetical protein|uniref:Uncharacterized protein n=1 Tax=Pseudomonas frederiksbergensis TaxID=104087 RepID=A0A423IQX7_9PSED|nr:hypothetical protein [Pseudomonas frederiksbergensis]RON27854.1 hypothetical protein BK661_24030 [Pseudomonas frederiksbergensis]